MSVKHKIGDCKKLLSGLADNLGIFRVVAAAVMVLTLVSTIFVVYAGARNEVVLVADGETIETGTFAGDVGELLQQYGIEPGAHDRVTPPPGTRLQDGMTVVVHRAVPVILQVGEQKRLVKTAAETVGELLRESKVVMGERDEVTPGPETKLEPDMHVKVDLVTVRIVEEEVPVPFNVRRENDNNIARGITNVVQKGVQGLERKTWEITYKNGKETGRHLVASTMIKKPVDQVVRVGALQVASRGGQEFRFTRAFDMISTAYTYTGNNTATGTKPRVGTVAVDPSVIPLGTRLFVEGYGYCRAMDVGSKIKGNRIDVFLETGSEAKRWGVKKVRVYVLE